jgi:hypothetical protein
VDATPKPTGNQFQTSGLGYVNQLGGAAMGVALTRTNDLTTDPAVFVGANAVGHYPLQMDAPPFAIGQITVNPDMSIWFPITSKNEEDPWPNLTDAGLYANSLFPVPGNPLAPPPQSILAPTLFPAQPAQTFGDAVHAAAAVIDGALVNNLPNFNLDADRGYGFAPGWHPKPGTNPSVPPVDVALD